MESNQFIGLQIDQYKIIGHIARGGMADVFEAEDVTLQRKVAIKILLNMLAADEQFVKRFQREARTVAKLDHPNIVQIYNTGLTPYGQPYIAMQFISGGSLRDLLRQWRDQGKVAPATQALAIMRHLAAALDIAHLNKIVHRDLKPSNVLIRADGTPVLVDLGIASITGSEKLTQTGSLMGTPHYMPPEQIRGLKVDGRSDLYSLGVILYELLAGIRPFEADDSIAILHKHVYEAPTPLRQLRGGLSPQTLEIVATCLEKEPNQRYQSATELMSAIDGALNAEGTGGYVPRTTVLLPDGGEDLISKPPVSGAIPHLPAEEPKKRNGFLWVGAAAVVLLLVLGALALKNNPFVISGSPTDDALPPTQIVVEVGGVEIETAVAEAVPDESTPEPITTQAPIDTPQPPPSETPQEEVPTNTPIPTDTPTPDLGPIVEEIAQSAGGIHMDILRFGNGEQKILLVGGISAGYSPGSVSVAQRLATYFEENPQEIPESITLFILTSLNPDSVYNPGERNGRFNANGVDLNRNWDCDWVRNADILGTVVNGSGGDEPFSEPEVKGLRDFILREQPVATIFWTARSADGLVSPGLCSSHPQVSTSLANVYGIGAGYRVVELPGTQGDVSNWLDQQGIPSIFILLPEYSDPDWSNNLAGIKAVITRYQ